MYIVPYTVPYTVQCMSIVVYTVHVFIGVC